MIVSGETPKIGVSTIFTDVAASKNVHSFSKIGKRHMRNDYPLAWVSEILAFKGRCLKFRGPRCRPTNHEKGARTD